MFKHLYPYYLLLFPFLQVCEERLQFSLCENVKTNVLRGATVSDSVILRPWGDQPLDGGGDTVSVKDVGRYALSITGGWWHFNWGGGARGNGWNRIGGMLSNTSNTWFDANPLALFHPLSWVVLPSVTSTALYVF
jgi:hypothetical protein